MLLIIPLVAAIILVWAVDAIYCSTPLPKEKTPPNHLKHRL